MVRREERNMRPGGKSAFAQERKCATTPTKRMSETLYLPQTDAKRIASPIAVHMKLFSTMERFEHLGSTNLCSTADAK